MAFGVFRATIVASLDGQQDVQCSKVHLLAAGEELNRRHARALSVSFERPRSPTWTSLQLTTSAFLESSSLCHCVLCECHYNGRCRHERRHPFLELVPRSAHLPSQWHIVKVTGSGNGATTTLPIPSPSHPCSRRRDRRSKLRKARRTKHENKESISIYSSCRC